MPFGRTMNNLMRVVYALVLFRQKVVLFMRVSLRLLCSVSLSSLLVAGLGVCAPVHAAQEPAPTPAPAVVVAGGHAPASLSALAVIG